MRRSASTHILGGRTLGTPITVRVAARNEVGQGEYSNQVTVAPVSAPSSPLSLTAVPAASGQVQLAWSPPASSGGTVVTDYVIERADGASGWVTVRDAVSPTTSATVTGLVNGTRYSFRVTAKNAIGSSTPSAAVAATPRTVPSAVRSLTAVPGASGQIRLAWVASSSNGGAAVSDYVVQRSTNGTSGWVTLNDGVRTTASYTATGLRNGTRYHFRVSAANAAGVGPASNVANSIPRTVPAAPRVRVYPGSGRAVVAWSAPATNGAAITRYAIQRSTRPTSGWVNLNSKAPATARSQSTTGLRNGTRYYFRVVAYNAAGTGTWSSVVSAVPSTKAGSGYYFANCTDARSAGAAPILRTQTGYRTALDRDRDGVACE